MSGRAEKDHITAIYDTTKQFISKAERVLQKREQATEVKYRLKEEFNDRLKEK